MMKYILILFMLFLLCGIGYSQKWQGANLSKSESFSHQIDSLFRIEAYGQIIMQSQTLVGLSEYKELPYLNLAVGYYFLAKRDSAEYYLHLYLKKHSERERTEDPYHISFAPFNNESLIVQRFLEDEGNKKKCEDFILNLYKQEPVQLTEEGTSIIKYTIDDQLTRGMYLMKMDSLRKRGGDSTKVLQDFNLSDNQNRNNLHKFYRGYKRIFTKREIGLAFTCQFLLFAHETDLNIRNEYLSYLKEAVKNNECGADRVISFIMRTEIIEGKYDKWFNEAFNKRIEELKAMYNVPDYTFNIY